MRETTIARNYAEALLALARKADDLDGWGKSINGVAAAIESDERLRNFLAAPQIAAAEKSAVLGKAFRPDRILVVPALAIFWWATTETRGLLLDQAALERQPETP